MSAREDNLQHYEAIADHFDTTYNRENSNQLYKIEQISKVMFEILPSLGRYDIMELGGGTGIHAYHLLEANAHRDIRYTLSDISPRMIEKAKVRLAKFNVDYIVTAAENLATDKTFDAIFCSGAMHHFEDARASIESIRDHLKPGGVVVVCEPIVWNPVNFVKAAKDSLEWSQFTVTRSNVARMLQENGLSMKVNRVLHWRAGAEFVRQLWPFEKLEDYAFLDTAAVMYLVAATKGSIFKGMMNPRVGSPNFNA
jgi:ubiquinone/menaquinone biosynthesis C-methylase UbiE